MTWYHLTYASAEASPGGSGGWDVQYSSSDTPEALQAVMRSGVTTRLESLDGLDEFADSAQLHDRTRRFSFRYTDGVGYVWWQAVDAGRDATGRPGNVFTHSVGALEMPVGLRPIDLWRSPSWLMPFGLHEVATATPEHFVAQGVLSRRSAIAQALDRPEETEALLAAVTMCLREGRAMVLASQTPDEFASWIAVISHLTSVGVAAGWLVFSTFDRAARLAQTIEHTTVVGIPTADLPLATRMAQDAQQAPLFVLDLDSLPTMSPAGSWEYAGQQWSARGLWLEAFFELTDETRYERSDVQSLLERMDELAGHDEDYRDPGVPLALAVLGDRDDEEERRELIEQWAGRLALTVREVEEMLGIAMSREAEPASLASATGPVVEAAGGGAGLVPETVSVRVTLPSREEASPAHRNLAEVLLAVAGAVTSPGERSLLNAWLDAPDAPPPPAINHAHLDDGVDHGTDR